MTTNKPGEDLKDIFSGDKKEILKMTIATNIIHFISKANKIPQKELGVETEIYNSGIISSLSLLELMAYIESQFHIIVHPEELIEDNFKDVGTLTAFVKCKTQAKRIMV